MTATLEWSPTWREPLERDGFTTVESVVAPERVEALLQITGNCLLGEHGGVLRRGGEAYGVRDLLWRVDEIRVLARSPELLAFVEPIIGRGAFAVRGLYFDKTAATNWNLPWHQDMTIAVRTRRDVEGFGPWTLKARIPHAIGPADLLARMVTIRLHLDDCGPHSGPMRVLPGSHLAGKLDASAITAWSARANESAVDCLVASGGVVIMRPLLLHASGSGTGAGHRRVIHLEYAAESLPHGLEWFGTAIERDRLRA